MKKQTQNVVHLNIFLPVNTVHRDPKQCAAGIKDRIKNWKTFSKFRAREQKYSQHAQVGDANENRASRPNLRGAAAPLGDVGSVVT